MNALEINETTPILSAQTWEPHVLGEIEVHDIHCQHADMDRPQPMAEIGHILAQKLKLLTESPHRTSKQEQEPVK